MKKSCLLLFIAVLCVTGCTNKRYDPEISGYVEFLDQEHPSGVDYILSLFDSCDVVVLCERDHAEITQYDFIKQLLSDKRFIEKVGNIFTEIGGANHQGAFDELLLGEIPLDSLQLAEKILPMYREISFYPLWNSYSYYYFLFSACEINRTLAPEEKLRVFPLDIAADWAKIHDAETLKQQTMKLRDQEMAQNALRAFHQLPSGRKKALIIQNDMHAFSRYEEMDSEEQNFMHFFTQDSSIKTTNILIHTLVSDYDCEQYTPIHDGKWDAAFLVSGKQNIGFNFRNTPFGNDPCDQITDLEHNLTYADVFTGMIYLPIKSCRLQWGIPGIISKEFLSEITRRHIISGQDSSQKTIMEWYNTVLEETYFSPDYCPGFNEQVNQWLKH